MIALRKHLNKFQLEQISTGGYVNIYFFWFARCDNICVFDIRVDFMRVSKQGPVELMLLELM